MKVQFYFSQISSELRLVCRVKTAASLTSISISLFWGSSNYNPLPDHKPLEWQLEYVFFRRYIQRHHQVHEDNQCGIKVTTAFCLLSPSSKLSLFVHLKEGVKISWALSPASLPSFPATEYLTRQCNTPKK